MNKNQVLKEILEWVKYLTGAFLFALIINNTVIINASIPSGSMENTIMTNSRVIGSRLAYAFNEPQRFDIIVFKYPDDESYYPLVKRIIALPNEKVEIKNGKVYINDSDIPLDDSFIKDEPLGDYGPFTVPDDCYFVMGDNRNSSHDSRFWTNKYVSKNKILAKVYAKYFPSVKLLH